MCFVRITVQIVKLHLVFVKGEGDDAAVVALVEYVMGEKTGVEYRPSNQQPPFHEG